VILCTISVVILLMHDIGQMSGMAGQALLRLWVTVYNVGKVAQGLVQLQTLRGTLSCYVVIGGQFGDFGISGCDELNGGVV
jgi:hypothetical protein